MSADRSSQAAWALIVILVLLAGYVGAYFGCSEYSPIDTSDGDFRPPMRHFPGAISATLFWPLLKLESRIRGNYVQAVYP